MDIMAGKIIRIDPANGNGIGPDLHPTLVANPYYDAANPASTKSRIWTMGNRNEFRLVVRPDGNVPGPGVLYVSEVGYYDWEEINVVRQGMFFVPWASLRSRGRKIWLALCFG
jgi:glucose/arabinose dehydrogenase